ncbi:hypothetical protein [Cloacibacillus porcorum]
MLLLFGALPLVFRKRR